MTTHENTIIAPTSTPIKKTKTTTEKNTLFGSRNMVTGVKTNPRTTKSTSTDAWLTKSGFLAKILQDKAFFSESFTESCKIFYFKLNPRISLLTMHA